MISFKNLTRLPVYARIMSTASAPRTRPEYTLKIAESKDEIEACYDIRVEGELQRMYEWMRMD
jgi:hypothetical protein